MKPTEKVSRAVVKPPDTAKYRVDRTDGSETEVARTATYSLLTSGATFTASVRRMGEEVVIVTEKVSRAVVKITDTDGTDRTGQHDAGVRGQLSGKDTFGG